MTILFWCALAWHFVRRQRLCQCSCASLDGACGCFLLACSYCRGGVRDGAVGVIRGGVFLSAVGIATVARNALAWRAKPYYNNGGWSAMLRSVGRPTPNFQERSAMIVTLLIPNLKPLPRQGLWVRVPAIWMQTSTRATWSSMSQHQLVDHGPLLGSLFRR